MPDYATIRMAIAGPEFEMKRFIETCILVQPGDTAPSLDFEALAPIPDAIIATLEDTWESAKKRALSETGYTMWDTWCMAHWGADQNTLKYCELVKASDRYACRFTTARTYPVAALATLARQYPWLYIQTFAIQEADGWAYVGGVYGGIHTGRHIEISQRLKFLVYDANPEACFPTAVPPPPSLPSEIMHASGMTAELLGVRDDKVATQRVNDAWAAARADIPRARLDQLQFAYDVDGYIEWLHLFNFTQNKRAPSLKDAQDALGRFVESDLNLRFFTAQRRCETLIGRDLMQIVAQVIREIAHAPEKAELDTATLISESVDEYAKDDLYEWASYETWQKGTQLNQATAETLRESVCAAGASLLEQALEHIRASSDPTRS